MINKFLKRALYFLTAVTFFLVLVFFIILFMWYIIFFFPYLDDLKKLAKEKEQEQSIKEIIYPMVVISQTKKRIRSYAVSQAYFSLVVSTQKNRTFHISDVLWYFVSYIHFSEDEIFNIWIECSFYGCGKGLQEAAHKHFGKDLNNLSKREMAKLVLMLRVPLGIEPNNELVESLLNRLHDNSH